MNTGELIRLLIVSDNHIVRSGLRQILEAHSRIVVIGDTSVRDARATEVCLKHHPELVLIDLDANGTEALALIRKLRRDLKNTAVLAMGDIGDDGRTRKALELGAAGVVLKLQPSSVLIAAIESLCNCPSDQIGVGKVEPQRVSSRIQSRGPGLHNMQKFASLTERERGIVALIASGITNKDIAEQLHISDITVRHHLTNIYVKVGVANRQKLLLLAYEQGLANLVP
jgi:DNA-binding NarL/FixJ family response regulator